MWWWGRADVINVIMEQPAIQPAANSFIIMIISQANKTRLSNIVRGRACSSQYTYINNAPGASP